MTHRIPAGSPRLRRRLNASAVLRTIRADGPISRVELARVTGLFPCAVLVDNEVHLWVLGERWRGSAQGSDDASMSRSASAAAS